MIRKAKKSDAKELAKINYLVMWEFFKQQAHTEEEKELQLQFLQQCIENLGTVFTYKNAIVAERDGEIAGAAWLYDFGKEMQRLNEMKELDFSFDATNPLLQFIEEEKHEAKLGDIYLDTLAVARKWQGKGVSSELLDYAKVHIEKHGGMPLTLLVDIENPHAQKVYEHHEFEVIDEKELYGNTYRYMRFN